MPITIARSVQTELCGWSSSPDGIQNSDTELLWCSVICVLFAKIEKVNLISLKQYKQEPVVKCARISSLKGLCDRQPLEYQERMEG